MARKQIDISLTDNDLTITAGDFASVESTLEHQMQLVANNKGDFKENPTICVGAEMFIDDDGGFGSLIREISRELSRDGMSVDKVTIGADGIIKTQAVYK